MTDEELCKAAELVLRDPNLSVNIHQLAFQLAIRIGEYKDGYHKLFMDATEGLRSAHEALSSLSRYNALERLHAER